jgi:hypothetical protein
MLDFFDRSFVSVIRKIIPARSVFTGDEVVVESHMLERSKVVYPYSADDKAKSMIIDGTVKIYRR